MTDKELEQKANSLMILFFEFLELEELEKFTDHDANLTESGEYLFAVIKKWLKDNIIEVEWEAERTRLWTQWTK